MNKKIITFLFLLFLFLFYVKGDFASVRINEIYPAAPSGEFEWVELYNDGSESVDLSSYLITDNVGKQIKLNSANIAPLNYVLATSSSVLNNDGDTIHLKNSNEEIETISYPSGVNADKAYAKCPDGSSSWFIVTMTTKNSSNNPACQNSTPSNSPTIKDDSLPTSTLTPQTYNNIYISEVMIDPETEAHEWIEIYNGNEFEVDLKDWYVDDLENAGTTPKQFSLTFPAKSYASYDLSSSIFNNDGDSVRLLDFNQVEIDSFQYQSSEKGKSLGRTSFDNDSFCLQIPTKQTSNGSCTNPSATSTPRSTTSSTSTITPTHSPLKTITTIKTPTKARPTVTPVKFSLFTQNQPPTSDSPQEINDSVLGITTNNETSVNTKTHALLSSLTFASFAYSLLAIISIFLKMKIN